MTRRIDFIMDFVKRRDCSIIKTDEMLPSKQYHNRRTASHSGGFWFVLFGGHARSQKLPEWGAILMRGTI